MIYWYYVLFSKNDLKFKAYVKASPLDVSSWTLFLLKLKFLMWDKKVDINYDIDITFKCKITQFDAELNWNHHHDICGYKHIFSSHFQFNYWF